jgi:hypothetical protein
MAAGFLVFNVEAVVFSLQQSTIGPKNFLSIRSCMMNATNVRITFGTLAILQLAEDSIALPQGDMPLLLYLIPIFWRQSFVMRSL